MSARSAPGSSSATSVTRPGSPPPNGSPPTTAPPRSRPPPGPQASVTGSPARQPQLNHALHLAAVTQSATAQPRPGVLRPQARRGKSEKGDPSAEAAHQRRHLPALVADADPVQLKRSGRTIRDDSLIQRGRLNPEHRHFGAVTPGPDHHATPAPTAALRRAPKRPLDTKRLRSRATSFCADDPPGEECAGRQSVRVRAHVIVVLVGVVVLSACGVGWKDYRISEVTVDEDGRTLTVGWHCHPDASVNATETARRGQAFVPGIRPQSR